MSERFTRPYHPQANGVCERNVGVIAERIAKTIKTGPSDWVRLLTAALMAMRAAENESTGYAPLSLLTCRDFLTSIEVELDGALEILEEELTQQGAEEDARRKETASEATEVAQSVAYHKRIANPKLPFRLQDESECEYKEIMAEAGRVKGKRRAGKFAEAAFDKSRTEAERMREDAAKNAAKKVAADKKYYDKAAKCRARWLKTGDMVANRQS